MRKANPPSLWMRLQTVAVPLKFCGEKILWGILKKLKITPPHDPGMLLLGMCPKDSTPYPADPCSTRFSFALFSWLENGNHVKMGAHSL